MPTDTTPAAVDAMIERLSNIAACRLPAPYLAVAEAAAMLRAAALERDRYRELASTTHRANMVSMDEADKLKDRIEAAEAEAAMLRRERDEARDQFDHHVVWASDQSAKLEAEAAALRGHIQKAYRALAPAAGDVEIVSPIAKPIYRAFGILLDALKETSDGL